MHGPPGWREHVWFGSTPCPPPLAPVCRNALGLVRRARWRDLNPARAAGAQGQGGKATDAERASTAGSFANISMNGSEVFKFAVRAVPMVRPPSTF